MTTPAPITVLQTPPRSTGKVEDDYPLLVDWMYRAYQIISQSVAYINTQADSARIDTNTADIATLKGRLDGQISDRVTLADANTGATITFGTPQPDTAFRVIVQPVAFTGVPTAESFIITSKTYTKTGFSFTLDGAPGAGTSVTYEWQIIRNT